MTLHLDEDDLEILTGLKVMNVTVLESIYTVKMFIVPALESIVTAGKMKLIEWL